jgi:hypothetical protein
MVYKDSPIRSTNILVVVQTVVFNHAVLEYEDGKTGYVGF